MMMMPFNCSYRNKNDLQSRQCSVVVSSTLMYTVDQLLDHSDNSASFIGVQERMPSVACIALQPAHLLWCEVESCRMRML
jgi:hypothetical protein